MPKATPEQSTKLNFWSDQKAEQIETDILNYKKSLEQKFESGQDIGFCCSGYTLELWFSETVFCERIANALKELFEFIAQAREALKSASSNTNEKHSSPSPIIVSRIQLDRCAGNPHANKVIHMALQYDVVETLCVDGRIGTYDLLTSDALSNLSSPLHLKELDLRYFRISAENIETLQKGILNPALRNAGGGLKRLSLCNTTFRDDAAFEQFAKAVSLLTQKPKQTQQEDEDEKGNHLETLWLYYCNLNDRYLKKLMQSLMTVNETTAATNQVESTLQSLTVEQAKCGPNFYELLGAWLLGCDTQLLSSPRESRSLCMLQVVNIFIWSAVSPVSAIDPVDILTRPLPWRSDNTETDDEGKKNELDASDKKINTVLKSLSLSGVSDMFHFGKLISEHFLGLESLKLHSRGSNDPGLTMDECSSFVSGSIPSRMRSSSSSKAIINPDPNSNCVLRSISFHCADKDTRTALESCPALEELLDRFPMLYDVKFGFKRSGSWRDDVVQQKMNRNASGRFLFFPSHQKPTGLFISLLPNVLVGFHKRLKAESESMYDENMRAWVESGSFGDGGGEDDDEFDENENDQSDTDDEGENENGNDENNNNNNNNNNEGERFELDMAVVHDNKNPQVLEQSASAIFELLKPNIEGLMFLRNSEEAQKGLKRNMETLRISKTVDNTKKVRREESR